MSKKKASGSSNQQTPRAGKRLGVKIYGGEKIKTGQIIVRQRGSKFHPGAGVKQGRDFTLFAAQDGQVKFRTKQGKAFVEVI
ncbi:50S ribosomal protein L27 [Patescibacteria group bacterium]|nr:50S ribosomal protein L27 [Patescibacteria group bacterium]MBU1931738.1 50S ribosomal protein L27 [Patescibacteria group bacterium]